MRKQQYHAAEASDAQTQIGRLALRHEGENWNAYYAKIGTMAGALPIGSIAIALVAAHPSRKQAFVKLMSDCVADLIEQATGARPTWGEPQVGPEQERAGHG